MQIRETPDFFGLHKNKSCALKYHRDFDIYICRYGTGAWVTTFCLLRYESFGFPQSLDTHNDWKFKMAATSENNLLAIGRDLSRNQRSLTMSNLNQNHISIGHFQSDQIRESQILAAEVCQSLIISNYFTTYLRWWCDGTYIQNWMGYFRKIQTGECENSRGKLNNRNFQGC